MKKMKGSEMVISALEKEQATIVFGYPGGAVLPLYDSLYDSSIQHYLSRHEQGAVHAADGYARSTGKPGVVFATSGPGATNLVTGIATAYMDSVPLVIFTGQVGSGAIGTDAFQEADITGITIPITKHNFLVNSAQELPKIIKEAFHLASTGRNGPVLIDLPKDIQDEIGEFDYPEKVDIQGYKPTIEGHPGQITRAVKMIKKAQKPLIIGGGGIIRSGASEHLYKLVEESQIPVCLTLMGLGGFPGDHPLFLGMLGMHGTRAANYAVMETDLIIAVGMRFDDRVTGHLPSFGANANVIHIDVDPAEIGKNIQVDIPIVGDVSLVLKRMLKNFNPGDTSEWLQKVKEWKEEDRKFVNCESPEAVKTPEIIKTIFNKTEDRETVIATDVGQHQMWTAQHFCFSRPRTLLSSGGLGTMGYGFPASIGAQVGKPDATVFCITGDGSFQMNIQELATAAHYQLPVKIMIINNSFLGMVRQWQELFFNRRYSSTSLAGNPDFCKVAEAYGVPGKRVSQVDEMESAIDWALSTEGPVVVEFVVETEDNVFPMVAPNRPLNEIIDKRGTK